MDDVPNADYVLVCLERLSVRLNYYYFVSTLISVGTMILLRKTTNETKLLAILEAKKKDPKQMKKTGFAARLEAMQKQQEQLQQQRQNKK